MNIVKLKYFVSVVERQNFTLAAKDNCVTQVAITQQIASMEKKFGVRLLIRMPNKIECTPAGEIFYQKALKVLADYQELENAVENYKKESMNVIKMGLQHLSEYGFMRSAINEMKEEEIVEFTYIQDTGEALYKKIQEGTLDFAVVDEKIENTDKNVSCLKILDYHMVVILPPNHELGARKNIYLRDLDGQTVVLPQTNPDLEAQFCRFCQQQKVAPKRIAKAENALTAIIMADSGEGIAVLHQEEAAISDQYMKERLSVKKLCFKFHKFLLWNERSKKKAVRKFVRKIQSQIRIHYPVVVQSYDYNRNPVEVTFCKEPERVIPINQNMIELLLYFGLADRIVACGVTDNDILPELWEDYETLTQLKGRPYPERVVVESFKPDLIMGWKSGFADKTLGSTQEWERKGIHALISCEANNVMNEPGLVGLYQDIRNIGRIFNITEQTGSFIQQAETEFRQLREKVSLISSPPRALLLELNMGELRAYGRDCSSGRMIELAGGINLVEKSTFNLPDWEVREMMPDIIYVVHYIFRPYEEMEIFIRSKFYESTYFREVPAIQKKRIHLIGLADVYASGIRTLPTLWRMYEDFISET